MVVFPAGAGAEEDGAAAEDDPGADDPAADADADGAELLPAVGALLEPAAAALGEALELGVELLEEEQAVTREATATIPTRAVRRDERFTGESFLRAGNVARPFDATTDGRNQESTRYGQSYRSRPAENACRAAI